jgi:hypothetical protein
MVVIAISSPSSTTKMAEVISQESCLPLFFIAVTIAIDLPSAVLCFSIFLKPLSFIAKIVDLLWVNISFLEYPSSLHAEWLAMIIFPLLTVVMMAGCSEL